MLLDGLISGITALDAATGGVFENVLPRGYTLPAVCIHQYDGSQESQFSGPTDVAESLIQVDCYGRSGVEVRTVAAAIRTWLTPFTGELPDGTIVQGAFLERDMAMPFLPHADQKGLADRWVLGYRIYSPRV